MSLVPVQFPREDDVFEQMTELSLATLESALSKIQYKSNYRSWWDYCHERNIGVVSSLNIRDIDLYIRNLTSKDNGKPTKVTRRSHYSALKLLLRTGTVYFPQQFSMHFTAISAYKVPYEGTTQSKRIKTALSLEELKKFLAFYDGNDLSSVRNAAIINLLASTAVREAECAALTWDCFNEDFTSVDIRKGKGNKQHIAAVISAFGCQERLIRLRDMVGDYSPYLFIRLTRSNDIHYQRLNYPVTTQTIKDVVATASESLGIYASPHTFRRTFVTLADSVGVSREDIQSQGNWSKAETIKEHYLKRKDQERIAKKMNDSFKI